MHGMTTELRDMLSHPSWVRGLKRYVPDSITGLDNVAPFMGAWIETATVIPLLYAPLVAPFMGAWIETWRAS